MNFRDIHSALVASSCLVVISSPLLALPMCEAGDIRGLLVRVLRPGHPSCLMTSLSTPSSLCQPPAPLFAVLLGDEGLRARMSNTRTGAGRNVDINSPTTAATLAHFSAIISPVAFQAAPTEAPHETSASCECKCKGLDARALHSERIRRRCRLQR